MVQAYRRGARRLAGRPLTPSPSSADPADPDRIRPDYDTDDAPHPDDAGLHAMAEAIDPRTL